MLSRRNLLKTALLVPAAAVAATLPVPAESAPATTGLVGFNDLARVPHYMTGERTAEGGWIFSPDRSRAKRFASNEEWLRFKREQGFHSRDVVIA